MAAIMWLLIFIQMSFYLWLPITPLESTKINNHSCYGGSSVSLHCSNGHRIAFNQVEFGMKINDTQNATSKQNTSKINLCSLSKADCLMESWKQVRRLDNAYKCSGEKQCTNILAQWTQIHENNILTNDNCPSDASGQTSSYMNINATCLKEEITIELCSDQSVTGKEVFLHNVKFPDYDMSTNYSCFCEATSLNESTTIQLTSYNVALIYDIDKDCDRFLSISDNNSSRKYNVNCSDFNLTGIHQFYNSSVNSISFNFTNKYIGDLAKLMARYQIWIHIQSESRENVTVTCNNTNYLGSHSTSSNPKRSASPTITRVLETTSLNIEIYRKEKERKIIIYLEIIAGTAVGLILISTLVLILITYKRKSDTFKKTTRSLWREDSFIS